MTEWTDPYEPTPEQEAADRQKAFEAGIPHGEYVYRQRYGNCPILSLLVISELHTDTEYGGPFWIHVPSKISKSMRATLDEMRESFALPEDDIENAVRREAEDRRS